MKGSNSTTTTTAEATKYVTISDSSQDTDKKTEKEKEKKKKGREKTRKYTEKGEFQQQQKSQYVSGVGKVYTTPVSPTTQKRKRKNPTFSARGAGELM